MASPPVTFPFWSGQTARIAARPAPANHAYIAWYGTLTGDIWHVAAAQILSEYAKANANVNHPFPNHAIRACLTIMRYDKRKAPGGAATIARPVAPQPVAAQAPAQDTDQTREFLYGEEEELGNQGPEAPCVSRGRKSWRYLKSIGLGASLVMVPDRMGQTAVAYANNTLSTAQADQWYDDRNSAFDTLMAARVDAITGPASWPTGTGPARDPGLIDLLASTSVVMQMMQHLGQAEAQKILGYRLSGGVGLTPRAQELAHRKVNALCAIIDGARMASGGTPKGVVLFNYRVGDVNRQHNANPTILGEVCTAAESQNLVTIVIPQMASSVYARHRAGIAGQTSYVFDLLDVASGSTDFMDDTAKAYFWHLVASFLQGHDSPLGRPSGKPPAAVATLTTPGRPKVVGLVGGRSGSTDLPGFVGLRVYSWEEPMLAVLEGRPGPTNSGAWTSKYYEIQGPQAVRLFNQYPVVVTGFLNLAGFKKTRSVREYLHIDVDDGALSRWLAGQNSIPPLPPTANKTFLQVRVSVSIPPSCPPLTSLHHRTSSQRTNPKSRRQTRTAASRSAPSRSSGGKTLSGLISPSLRPPVVGAQCETLPQGRTLRLGLMPDKARSRDKTCSPVGWGGRSRA